MNKNYKIITDRKELQRLAVVEMSNGNFRLADDLISRAIAGGITEDEYRMRQEEDALTPEEKRQVNSDTEELRHGFKKLFDHKA